MLYKSYKCELKIVTFNIGWLAEGFRILFIRFCKGKDLLAALTKVSS